MDDDIDALYALPPSRFVEARNALASARSKAGDKAGAKTVKALTKPSAAAYLLNTLVRHDRLTVDAFLEATDRLARAQLGGGDRQALLAAGEAQKKRLAELMARAEARAAEGEVSAGRPLFDRLGSLLRHAALVPALRRELLAARLSQEPGEGEGFDPFAAVAPALSLVPPLPLEAEPPSLSQEPPDLEASRRAAAEEAQRSHDARRAAERAAAREAAQARWARAAERAEHARASAEQTRNAHAAAERVLELAIRGEAEARARADGAADESAEAERAQVAARAALEALDVD